MLESTQVVDMEQVATLKTENQTARTSKTLLKLPARRCFSCGSARFVNLNGIPECRDCASYETSGVIEYLRAESNGRRLIWVEDCPQSDSEPECDTNPTHQVYASTRLNFETIPLWLRCADVIEIGDERFCRLDRDCLAWLASRVELLPDPARSAAIRELESICVTAVSVGVLGDWAASRDNWIRPIPADWDPWADFELRSIPFSA